MLKKRDYSFNVQELDDGQLVTLDELFSIFNVDDQRISGFVQWGVDLTDSTKLELGVRGEQTNLEIDLDRGRAGGRCGRARSARWGWTWKATRSRSTTITSS